MTKKILFIAIFALFFLVNPVTTRAFQIERLIDPACFFACDNEPQVIHNTNSNNVNSNINSPNGVVNPNLAFAYDANYDESIGVTCYPTVSNVSVGGTVVWRASAYGGSGNYNYVWSGTNISGGGSSVTAQYNSAGTKTAGVVVTSGNKTASANCGNVIVFDTSSNNNNYNYNYDYNYNNTSQLGATCYPSISNANIGDAVVWRATPYGGTGNYYFSWNGTNGLSGGGSSIVINYNSPGTKSASVTINSGGQTITRSCSTVNVNDYNNYNNYNYNYNNNYNSNCLQNNGYTLYNSCDNSNYYYNNYGSPLIVSCSANTTFAPVGTHVIWQTYVSGGNGYNSYSWYGSDSIFGSDRLLDTIYNSPGQKTASVTVRSGNQSITQACTNTVTVGVPTTTYTPTYTAPVYTPPATTNTIIKYVEVPAKKVAEKPKAEATTTASLFSLSNISWGWVAFLVILVLLFTVIYLVFTRKN